MAKPRFFVYALAMLLVNLLICSLFCMIRISKVGLFGCAYLISQWIGCAFLYGIPSFVLTWFAYLLQKKRRLCLFFEIVAGIFSFLSTLILLIDFGILLRFGYHINGMVINLVMTPGGFESMGLDAATLAPGIVGILLYAGLHVFLPIYFLHTQKLDKICMALSRPALRYSVLGCCVFFLGLAHLICALGDFYANSDILGQYEAYPIGLQMRMRSFMLSLGFKEPPREATYQLMKQSHANLSYPAKPIERQVPDKKYNIIWLTGESLRADFLSADIMPNSWNLAQKSWYFEQHYSGGHGTRPAMFSMFYGLYGTNWGDFLRCRRAPLFFDWLHEDNYRILCQTSAKFSYPEFDKTIFASVKTDDIIEIDKREPAWKRDMRLIDNMIDFIEAGDGSQPFFAFGFFESTHAPYTFPEDETVLRKDYMRKLNYATISEKDAQALFNRDVNAAHHVDLQIKRLLDVVHANPKLRDSTIIVITGDHGEEFYEKGRLGHNSTFVEEQIRTPLLIHVPGMAPCIVTKMTHHTDIIPSLAPLMGVKNAPEDYAVGLNLFAADYARDSFVVCGWDEAVLVNADYKCELPISKKSLFAKAKITKRDDSPCPDDVQKTFFVKYASQLKKAQDDISRFE